MRERKRARRSKRQSNPDRDSKRAVPFIDDAGRDAPWPDPEPERKMVNKWAAEQDVNCGPWHSIDEHGNEQVAHEAAYAVLARAGDAAGEVWLWCLHCARFFQAKHLKLDFLGNWQQCPFDDCGAAGLDVDILTWDAYKLEDLRWPRSVDDLRFGMRVGETNATAV